MTFTIKTFAAASLLMLISSFSAAPKPSGTYTANAFEFFPAMSTEESGYAEVKKAVEDELAKLAGKVNLTFHDDGSYEGNSPEGKDLGNWRISEDGKTLTLSNTEKSETEQVNIISLTETALTLEYTIEEGKIHMKFTK